MITTRPFHDLLIEYLSNPKEAAAYLNAVAEDGDLPEMLEAIRDVAEARGGIGALAKKTGLSRTTLYKTLSAGGNPEVATLDGILGVYGMRLGFSPLVREKAGKYLVKKRRSP